MPVEQNTAKRTINSERSSSSSRDEPQRRGAAQSKLGLLFVAAACGVGIAAVGLVAFHLPQATRLDAEGYETFLLYRTASVAGISTVTLARAATDSVSLVVFIPIGLVLSILAFRRRRPLIVVAMAVVLLGSVVSSAAIKSVAGEPSAEVFQVTIVGGSSFPSGHATASMALVLCALLAVPRWWTGVVTGVGALYALMVGYGLILRLDHLPSDVIAGYLMAGLWATVAVLGLQRVEARQPPRTTRSRRPPRPTPLAALLVVFAVAVAGTVVAVASRPSQTAPRAFASCAIGIALVAVVVIFVFAGLTSDGGTKRGVDAGA